MGAYRTVAQVGEIPDGEGRAFVVDGRQVAVFLVDGQYSAIDDACPHMGASLASGHVQNGGVTCPRHGWRFSVQDGTWLDNPCAKLAIDHFPVRVAGNDIQVQVPAGTTGSSVSSDD